MSAPPVTTPTSRPIGAPVPDRHAHRGGRRSWRVATALLAGFVVVPVALVASSILTPDREVWRFLWQTGLTVKPGGRLRVEVASAAFPLFSRNLNTGGHNEKETAFVSARQTIYHDRERPSHVVLPAVPGFVAKKP